MSNKKYRLLKDLPYIMAGVVYVKADGFNGVHDRCSYVPDKMGMMHERFALHSDWVEDNPDWFQEVVEPEPNQPEFPVEEIKALTSLYKDMIAHIRQQKYTEADLDKARREGVSNGETMYSLEDVRKALHGEWGTGNAVENVLNRLRNYKK